VVGAYRYGRDGSAASAARSQETLLEITITICPDEGQRITWPLLAAALVVPQPER
jgi:hypothetical protein